MWAVIAALVAGAAEPVDPEVGAAEEIVVWGESARKAAREGVVRALDSEGYQHRRTRNGKDVFVAPQPYKPKVILDRDGWVTMRRRALVWVGADGRDDATTNKAHDAWCLLFPPACISTMGLQISKRKLDGERAEAFLAMEDALATYRDVLLEEGHRDRLESALPAELDRLWFDGVAADGTAVPDPIDRRDRIVALWLDRVDDRYGDAAREVIEHFLADHVQDSAYALTAEEIAAIDDRYTGRRTFRMPGHAPAAEGAEPPPPLAIVPAPAPPPVRPTSAIVGPPIPQSALPGLRDDLALDVPTALELPPLQARPTFLQWLRGDEQDAVQATSAQGDMLDADAPPGLQD